MFALVPSYIWCIVFTLWAFCWAEETPAIKIAKLPQTGPDGAYVTCPCINVSAAVLAGNFSAVGSNLPPSYGSSCKAWDCCGSGWNVCRVAKPGPFCYAKWCYVDGSRCSLPNSYSQNVGFHYTWAGCGAIDFMQASTGFDEDRVFRNGLLAGGMKPSLSDHVQRAVLKRYGRELLEDLGINPDFQVVHQEITMDAYKTMPDSGIYTRCVFDIAIGLLDFCLYDYWLDHTRINTGAFPIAVTATDFKLFVRSDDKTKETWQESLEKPFKPFSWALWGLCAAVVVAYALLLSIFQASVDETQEGHGVFDRRTFYDIMFHIYLSFLGFFSCGTIEAASQFRPASKVLTLGFAFFILIAVASFTGSSASFMLSDNRELAIQTLEDAFSAGVKICYPSEVEAAVLPKYPQLETFGVRFLWSSERTIFDEVKDGKCKVAIASYSYSITDPNHCGFIATGPPLHSLPTGFFVSKDLGTKFLFHNSKLQELGVWDRQFQPDLDRKYPCPEYAQRGLKLKQMQEVHMIGNAALVVATGVIALVAHCCIKSEQQIEVELKRRNSRRSNSKSSASSATPDAFADRGSSATKDDRPSLVGEDPIGYHLPPPFGEFRASSASDSMPASKDQETERAPNRFQETVTPASAETFVKVSEAPVTVYA